MKIKVSIITQDEQLSGFAIKTETGLVLRNHLNILFATGEARRDELRKFVEFVDALIAGGFEVEDWPNRRKLFE